MFGSTLPNSRDLGKRFEKIQFLEPRAQTTETGKFIRVTENIRQSSTETGKFIRVTENYRQSSKLKKMKSTGCSFVRTTRNSPQMSRPIAGTTQL